MGLGPSADLRRLAWSYPQLPSLREVNAVLDVHSMALLAYPGVPKVELEGLSKVSESGGREADSKVNHF